MKICIAHQNKYLNGKHLAFKPEVIWKLLHEEIILEDEWGIHVCLESSGHLHDLAVF